MAGIEVIFNNIWVLFLLFTLVWPRLRQQALDRARKRELSNLGVKRGSNVITLIHRQETLSLFGLPIARYIDIDDSEEVLRAIRLTPDETPIDIIIHTPGGITPSWAPSTPSSATPKGPTPPPASSRWWN